ncbi:hypothetical protein SAMN04487820_104125 [Actinopolyspora mzabensis]|uniref:DUF8017 domain-containing protein n=1 Tax=Actinopolyspora mzabensis TaxID=995066 RepID=A0A1G8YXU8_ACTMZ|nr:hypothetical protein [Actinopolyspora mzabensis]SDK07662.1 hypothetical protein SAMN04487820_104125 [Actinopolyspora mzabensis]
MSLPGGSNSWTGPDGGAQRYYDPLTGQPVPRDGSPAAEQPPYGHSRHGASSAAPQAASNRYGTPSWPLPRGESAAPPERSRGPTIAVVSTAIASVVIIITTLVLVNLDDEGDGNGSVAAGSTSTTADSRRSVPAAIPGWQSVPVRETGVAYDVPSDWTPHPDAVNRLGNSSAETVTLSGYSLYMEGFCDRAPQSFRALIGLTSSTMADNAKAGRKTIDKLGNMLWTTSDGTPPRLKQQEPRQVTLDDGKLTATFVSAEIVPATTETCITESAYIGAMALPYQQGTAILVGMADQEFDGAETPDTMERALRSLRLLPG